jgi:hypothetical protein
MRCRCLFSGQMLLGALFTLGGCGAMNSTMPQTTALAIVLQPSNATVPLGQTATFTVRASGPASLSYQWSKNNVAIPGATGPAYTTASVVASDSGSTYTVTVSDNIASVTSSPAQLTAGPRSPANGDLRFQQVDSVSTASIMGYGNPLAFAYPIGMYYPQAIGTPLRLGAGQCVPTVAQDCWWGYTVYQSPTGTSLSVTYWANLPGQLDTDLNAKSDSSSVVTSLDIESPDNVYGISYLQGMATGFDYVHETSSLSSLPGMVATDGAKGRVVTAVSFNDASGQIDFLSYGWASDAATVYETNVQTPAYNNIGDAATTFANSGYIITAFGGNGTDGYILVGTRVKGDSIPRPILVSPDASVSIQGYARVGWAVNTVSGSNPSPPVWLFEK